MPNLASEDKEEMLIVEEGHRHVTGGAVEYHGQRQGKEGATVLF